MKLEDVLEIHMERCSNFEAAMEMLCYLISEQKRVLHEQNTTAEFQIKKIKEIKEALTNIRANRFTESELKLLNNFISKNILLCDRAIEALSRV